MGITLTFTDEQLGGDIELQDSAIGTLQYDPVPPSSAGAASVTETITVYINSGAKAARTGNGYIHRLERYFERARRRQLQGTGVRIWVKYKPYDADDTFRSEVLDGRVVWRTGTAAAAWMPSDTGECAIIFTRKPYWEADTEVEIPLANGDGNGTGGRDIVNHNDSETADDNWVLIDSTDIEGSLPAPVRIEFENNSGSDSDKQFWICHTIETDDGSGSDQIWTLEGEDNEHSPGTSVPASSSSGDFYMPESWTATTETLVYRWTLNSAYLAAAAGNPFRAVARFVSQNYSNLYARLVIQDGGGLGEVWSSPLILMQDGEILDFGTIPSLPPLLGSGLGGYTSHRVCIYLTRNTSGTHTVNLDCVHMFPIDGGFRYLDTSGAWGVNDGQKLIDDGIYERTYRDASAIEWAMFIPQGDYIKVVPGRTQRIAFLWQTDPSAPVATANRAAIVRMYYRPRRASF